MRKLLAAFLMTLRWLLVLLLPVLGLVVGWGLMPMTKPLWEQKFLYVPKSAGIVTIDEQPRLVITGGETFNIDSSEFEFLTLDLATGETVSATQITTNSQSRMDIVSGTTKAIYREELESTSTVRVSDWKTKREVRGRANDVQTQIHSLAYQNQVLIIDYGFQRPTLEIWRFGEDKLIEPIKINIDRMYFSEIQLSTNGNYAAYLYGQSRDDAHVVLIDTRQGKIIQKLADNIHCVRWLPNQDAFMVLHKDAIARTQHWQRYELHNETFDAVGTKMEMMNHGMVLSPGSQSCVVLVSSNKDNPARVKWQEWLGKNSSMILDRIWPETITFDLYQVGSGEPAQSLTIPVAFFSKTPDISGLRTEDTPFIYPDPNRQGFVMHQGRTISYWEFYLFSRWYPRLGLFLGITLAILLAWRNFRRSSRTEVKPVHA